MRIAKTCTKSSPNIAAADRTVSVILALVNQMCHGVLLPTTFGKVA